MKRILFVALSVLAATAMSFSIALAGNPFAGETTTRAGYSIWDSDLINVENVSQTGDFGFRQQRYLG